MQGLLVLDYKDRFGEAIASEEEFSKEWAELQDAITSITDEEIIIQPKDCKLIRSRCDLNGLGIC